MEKVFYLLLLMTFVACTNEESKLTDMDGNTYSVKDYQGVLWMTENLRTTKDKNGNSVLYFNPNDDQQTKEEYGLLYDYETACKVCPEGWILPDNEDWEKLIRDNGGEQQSHMFKDSTYWSEEGSQAKRNEFSARPAGYGNNGEHPNNFAESSIIWSKTKNEEFAWAVIFERNKNKVRKAEQHLTYGFSVRCIKK